MTDRSAIPTTTYVELQVTSHFSFLRGASAPEELFAAAALLGHGALGLCDRGSVAGMVRGLSGQEATGVRLIPGSRVEIGRATCWERGCQYVLISGGAVS